MQPQIQDLFTGLLDEYAGYARRYTSAVKSYSSAQVEGLSWPGMQELSQVLDRRLSVFRATEKQTPILPNLDTEKRLFKEALRVNGYTTYDDVTNFFEYGDLVEIYDLNLTQVYGNLEFMKFCSYDLFTLCTTPYYELYARSEITNNKIQTCMNNCFEYFTETRQFAVEPHLLREQHMDNKKVFRVQPKFVSPLKGPSGKTEACVMTNLCTEYTVSAVL